MKMIANLCMIKVSTLRKIHSYKMLGDLALESFISIPQLFLMFLKTFLNSWIKVISLVLT